MVDQTPHISPQLASKLDNYKTPQRVINILRAQKVLFLVGISGAGKDTIVGQLIKSGKYHLIVSHTTRPMRSNDGVMERDGVEYHFVDPTTIESMIDNEQLIEAKNNHGKIYGTSVEEFERAADEDKIAVTEIDVKGASEYFQFKPDTVALFVVPPSPEEWLRRLKHRYQSDWEEHVGDIRVRMETAESELAHALESPHYTFVINDDLSETVKAIETFVDGSDVTVVNDMPARTIARELLVFAQTRPLG